MVSPLSMQIQGRLWEKTVESSEPQTEVQTGLHKQAEQQILWMMFLLPMQIQGLLLVNTAQSSEPQTAERHGFHNQAEQHITV